jgi:hypothetical protein
VDSDPDVPMMRGPQSTSSQNSSQMPPRSSPYGTSDSNADGHGHLRPPRNLPQLPPSRSGK